MASWRDIAIVIAVTIISLYLCQMLNLTNGIQQILNKELNVRDVGLQDCKNNIRESIKVREEAKTEKEKVKNYIRRKSLGKEKCIIRSTLRYSMGWNVGRSRS